MLRPAAAWRPWRQRRREYYLDTDRNGHHQLEAGDIAEARVVSVIRPGAFVELFGIEQFIPLEELSYLRWVDATTHFLAWATGYW